MSELSQTEITRGVRVLRRTPTSTTFGILLGALTIALALLPFWGSAAMQRKLVELMSLLALAQMWNLLAGFGGVVSVGQQAFFGLGAYGMIFFVNVHKQDLFWSVPLAALLAAMFSIPLGFVAFRLRGSYFAIGTWVMAEVCSKVIITQQKIGGGNTISLKVAAYDRDTRADIVYWLALIAGVGSVLLVYLLLRSSLGLRMQAVRDSEGGAQGLGVDVYRTRFTIWVIAALWTGFTGAVYYIQKQTVIPTGPGGAFSVILWTAPVIFVVVIGGLGTIEGPIIGTVVYYFLKSWLKDYGGKYLIGTGIVAILIALFLQRGLWGRIRQSVGLDLFPVRRRVEGLAGNPRTKD
jgi:branched-chain amino acid transport system permease protein